MLRIQAHYRHDYNHAPYFVSHADVQRVAAQVRAQLVPEGSDEALSLDRLSMIESLDVNGVEYALWLDLEHPVHDDEQNPVFGVFEYMPSSAIDAVSVSVSPQSDELSDEVRLSTLAHELGHAIFDGPALVVHHQDRPRHKPLDATPVRAFRMITENLEQLTRADDDVPEWVKFAELRANEFMGSLLVPRDLLWAAILELQPAYGYEIEAPDTEWDSAGEQVSERQRIKFNPFDFNIDAPGLAEALAPRFGVTPIFVYVRMRRYGMID
jgi:hypothetical protein